jgi:hypothetical protein
MMANAWPTPGQPRANHGQRVGPTYTHPLVIGGMLARWFGWPGLGLCRSRRKERKGKCPVSAWPCGLAGLAKRHPRRPQGRRGGYARRRPKKARPYGTDMVKLSEGQRLARLFEPYGSFAWSRRSLAGPCCEDCLAFKHGPMLHDELWATIATPRTLLCFTCIEHRTLLVASRS